MPLSAHEAGSIHSSTSSKSPKSRSVVRNTPWPSLTITPSCTLQCFAMSASQSACRCSRSAAVPSASFAGSKWGRPRQPARSRPLKSAVHPAGATGGAGDTSEVSGATSGWAKARDALVSAAMNAKLNTRKHVRIMALPFDAREPFLDATQPAVTCSTCLTCIPKSG